MMSPRNAWRLLVVIIVLTVSGCSIASKRNASLSRDDHQACLAANPDNGQACEDPRPTGLRLSHSSHQWPLLYVAQLDALKCRLLTQIDSEEAIAPDCCHAVALILGHHRGGRWRRETQKSGWAL